MKKTLKITAEQLTDAIADNNGVCLKCTCVVESKMEGECPECDGHLLSFEDAKSYNLLEIVENDDDSDYGSAIVNPKNLFRR